MRATGMTAREAVVATAGQPAPAAVADETALPLIEPDKQRSSGRRWLGVVISAISVLGFTWWALNQETPPHFPTSAEALTELAVAVLVYALATVVRGWRWHVLLRRSGVEHHAVDAYALVPVGYMGNTVLPARGGELLRVVLLADRSPARKREIGGAIIAERLLDAIVLAGLFCILTFAGVAGTPAGTAPAWAGAALLAGGGIVAAIALRLRGHQRLRGLVVKVKPVATASVLLLRPVGALLALVTAGVWMLEGSIFALVGRSLELDIAPVDGLFLVVLASFFALIPAAPAYAGTFDAAVVFGLKALKITGGSAVSFALLVRAVLFIPITIAGLVLLLVRYRGWRVLRTGGSRRAR
jgi:uncharacterized membrane protein YbhN (UPF0104 family)